MVVVVVVVVVHSEQICLEVVAPRNSMASLSELTKDFRLKRKESSSIFWNVSLYSFPKLFLKTYLAVFLMFALGLITGSYTQ